jgi:RimJ/RimL family protein N-acetyltransferase
MTELITPRMWLRPLTKTDLEALARLYSDPKVMKYRLIAQPACRQQTQEMLNVYLKHWEAHGFGRWAIIHKRHQHLIGHTGLEYLDPLKEVEVNYLLARDYWGQGLASEAATVVLRYGFETLQLERLVALAKPGNLASRRVMEKIGMQYEQTLELYEVEWVLYAIHNSQWQQVQNDWTL